MIYFFWLLRDLFIKTLNIAVTHIQSPKKKKARLTSNGGPISMAAWLMDQANKLPPTVGAIDLNKEENYEDETINALHVSWMMIHLYILYPS